MPTALIVDSGDTEAINAYVFSSTLAAQDITGLATSGVSAAHVIKRLEGSSESRSYLFALTSREAPRPLGEMGYPAIQDDLFDVEAWVFISLPLLEDVRVLEAHVTLDAAIAPLPGEEIPAAPWAHALSLIDALSNALHRPIRHVWVTHSLGANEPPALRENGYTPAFSEIQATLPLEAVPAPEHAVDVVADMNFAPEDVDSFLRLLASASANYPRGELILDTVDWTRQRLTDAGARLRDRGGTQLTALARSESGDVVGLAEAVTFDHDVESVCELGLVYVLPEHRGRGLGCDLVAAVLCASRERWEGAETAFASYPAGEVAAEALVERFSVDMVSATTVWQRQGKRD
ncbi:GNAT family N-acetyltransferase [Corynebacterium sanguinis]|uniref:GNAT family N-acetyltransferase n=1 Tax=Corynebacterium sanguinis TaxID=2594913 RepID=UPI0021AE6938|nr:GNAT family N-acetyltransferase [Corynebacterium sanguinis]MCT1585804.1 GNAT family N-acetyltransferase [Corynebacterium sanguinis]MCT2023636.1 GNAT family N-acetyltransferase [Corynebacterium sanguinis]MCT2046619.1 GNAT family N-acetyltransferase [Corynebacterium sanguinis]